MLAWQAEVAQSVEHTTENRGVGSSILPLGTSRLFPATLPNPPQTRPPPRFIPPPFSEGRFRRATTRRAPESLQPCYSVLTEEQECGAVPDYPHHSLRIMHVACSEPLGAPNATVRVGGPRQTASEHPEQSRTNLNKSERRRTLRPDRNARQTASEHPEQTRTNLNKSEHRQAPRPDRDARQIAPEHPEKRIPNNPERSDECASLIAPGFPWGSAADGDPT